MMLKIMFLLAAALAVVAADYSMQEKATYLKSLVNEKQSENNKNHELTGWRNLRNRRIVKTGRRSLASASAFNKYYYEGDRLYLFVSEVLDVCICGETIYGTPLCEIQTAITNADRSVTKTMTQYSTTQQCDGPESASSTRTYTYPVTYNQHIGCGEGISDILVTNLYGSVGSTNAYESIGAGLVTMEYASSDDCDSGIPLEITFIYPSECGKGVYGSYPTNCSLEYTQIGLSSNQLKTIGYTDGTCTIQEQETVVTLLMSCISTDNNDDNGNDQVDEKYENLFFQGASSSSSTSSDVTLTESEYAGLVSAIVIAFIIGIVLAMLVIYFCVKPTKEAMSNKDSSEGTL
jgi:hypothetical protein